MPYCRRRDRTSLSVYHEKQSRFLQHCAVHTLNNLLQAPIYTAKHFEELSLFLQHGNFSAFSDETITSGAPAHAATPQSHRSSECVHGSCEVHTTLGTTRVVPDLSADGRFPEADKAAEENDGSTKVREDLPHAGAPCWRDDDSCTRASADKQEKFLPRHRRRRTSKALCVNGSTAVPAAVPRDFTPLLRVNPGLHLSTHFTDSNRACSAPCVKTSRLFCTCTAESDDGGSPSSYTLSGEQNVVSGLKVFDAIPRCGRPSESSFRSPQLPLRLLPPVVVTGKSVYSLGALDTGAAGSSDQKDLTDVTAPKSRHGLAKQYNQSAAGLSGKGDAVAAAVGLSPDVEESHCALETTRTPPSAVSMADEGQGTDAYNSHFCTREAACNTYFATHSPDAADRGLKAADSPMSIEMLGIATTSGDAFARCSLPSQSCVLQASRACACEGCKMRLLLPAGKSFARPLCTRSETRPVTPVSWRGIPWGARLFSLLLGTDYSAPLGIGNYDLSLLEHLLCLHRLSLNFANNPSSAEATWKKKRKSGEHCSVKHGEQRGAPAGDRSEEALPLKLPPDRMPGQSKVRAQQEELQRQQVVQRNEPRQDTVVRLNLSDSTGNEKSWRGNFAGCVTVDQLRNPLLVGFILNVKVSRVGWRRLLPLIGAKRHFYTIRKFICPSTTFAGLHFPEKAQQCVSSASLKKMQVLESSYPSNFKSSSSGQGVFEKTKECGLVLPSAETDHSGRQATQMQPILPIMFVRDSQQFDDVGDADRVKKESSLTAHSFAVSGNENNFCIVQGNCDDGIVWVDLDSHLTVPRVFKNENALVAHLNRKLEEVYLKKVCLTNEHEVKRDLETHNQVEMQLSDVEVIHGQGAKDDQSYYDAQKHDLQLYTQNILSDAAACRSCGTDAIVRCQAGTGCAVCNALDGDDAQAKARWETGNGSHQIRGSHCENSAAGSLITGDGGGWSTRCQLQTGASVQASANNLLSCTPERTSGSVGSECRQGREDVETRSITAEQKDNTTEDTGKCEKPEDSEECDKEEGAIRIGGIVSAEQEGSVPKNLTKSEMLNGSGGSKSEDDDDSRGYTDLILIEVLRNKGESW